MKNFRPYMMWGEEMEEWAENDDEWRDMLEEGDFMEVDLEPGSDTSSSDDSDEEHDLV